MRGWLSGGFGRVRTKRYRHSRYPLRALLNRLLGPARLGDRKLGGPYQKVLAPSFLLPIGREAAGGEGIIRFRTRRYSCLRSPPAPASPFGGVVVFDPVSHSFPHDGGKWVVCRKQEWRDLIL
eukprot:2316021-Pleurochrysis_carterae.AAC.1